MTQVTFSLYSNKSKSRIEPSTPVYVVLPVCNSNSKQYKYNLINNKNETILNPHMVNRVVNKGIQKQWNALFWNANNLPYIFTKKRLCHPLLSSSSATYLVLIGEITEAELLLASYILSFKTSNDDFV